MMEININTKAMETKETKKTTTKRTTGKTKTIKEEEIQTAPQTTDVGKAVQHYHDAVNGIEMIETILKDVRTAIDLYKNTITSAEPDLEMPFAKGDYVQVNTNTQNPKDNIGRINDITPVRNYTTIVGYVLDIMFEQRAATKFVYDPLTKKQFKKVSPINAQVVCVATDYSWWTVGKIYRVINGVVTADDGSIYPRLSTLNHERIPYCTKEELEHIGSTGPSKRYNEKNTFVVLKD